MRLGRRLSFSSFCSGCSCRFLSTMRQGVFFLCLWFCMSRIQSCFVCLSMSTDSGIIASSCFESDLNIFMTTGQV